MERIEVSHGFIVAHRYFELQKELVIWFRDGRKWTHADVPQELYKRFSESPNPMGFWAIQIRQARVNDAEPKSYPVIRAERG